MSTGEPDAVVLGAGVCGLTTAVCLAEAGLSVTVRAAQPPLETTSVAAGAIWGPHLVENSDRVAGWGASTLATLLELTRQPGTGVRMTSGIEVWREPGELPPWSGAMTGSRRCEAGDLPAGFADGWRYTAPLVTMTTYLGYLLDRFTRGGGQLSIAPAASLADLAAPVVVNCTGVGAARLTGDPDVRPVRGQVVVVSNPGLTEFVIAPGDATAELLYLFPHGDTVLLGGTEQYGDWSMDPDPAAARRILAGCTAIEPRLARARVVGHRVGLRPFRPRVRLEAERAPGRLVIHNYGHGGAGITLSWGCAREVAGLVG